MNKMQYYRQALMQIDALSELPYSEGLELLQKLYGTTYHLTSSFEQHIIQQLIDLGLVETSTDKCAISALGQELIETAAKLYGDEHVTTSHGSVKREITTDFVNIKDFAVEYIKSVGLDVKSVKEDRSNFLIFFASRVKGIPGIEIKNKPEIRVCVRKAPQEAIDTFSAIGMTYRVASTQTYFDMPKSEENIKKLVDTIVEYIK